MTDKLLCPLLKKPCIGHDCAFFTHVIGQHPQTGVAMDLWDCAVVWMPILMASSIKEHRHTTASVDSMRNEVVKRQDILNAAIEERKHEPPVIDYDPYTDSPRIRPPVDGRGL